MLVVLSGRYCDVSTGFPDGRNELNDIVALELAEGEKLSFLLTTIAVVVYTLEGEDCWCSECNFEVFVDWLLTFPLGIAVSGEEIDDKSCTLDDKLRKLDVFAVKDGLAATAGGRGLFNGLVNADWLIPEKAAILD